MESTGEYGILFAADNARMPCQNVFFFFLHFQIYFLHFLSHNFKFSQPEPFFRILYREMLAARLELTDLLQVDFEIKQAIFEFVRLKSEAKSARKNSAKYF